MWDQALFTGAHFVMNVLLARWLTAEEYGEFAIAFSVFLLLGVVHTGILTEPMLVHGAARFRERFPAYLRVLLLRGHAGFSVLVFGMLSAIAGLMYGMGSVHLAAVLFTLALIQPFALFLWLIRRAAYVRGEHHIAAKGGLIYLAGLTAVIAAAQRGGALSLYSALAAVGGVSLLAGIYILWRTKGSVKERSDEFFRIEVARAHWDYGRWSVGTGALQWIPSQAMYLLLPVWWTLEDAGALRAGMNLVMPVVQALSALSVFMIPELVRSRASGGFAKLVTSTFAVFLLGSIAFGAALAFSGTWVLDILYGGRYEMSVHVVWLIALFPVCFGVLAAGEAALRSLERPDAIFWGNALATGLTLTLGLVLIARYGMPGALILQLVASVGAAACLLLLLTRSKLDQGFLALGSCEPGTRS